MLTALLLALYVGETVDQVNGIRYCLYNANGARYVLTLQLADICPASVDVDEHD